MIKTGLGIGKKIRVVIARYNLFSFTIRKYFFGFEYANVFLKRIDKHSLQLILRKNGARIGEKCDIESGITFHNCNRGYSNLIVGNNCHIGKNCFFDLRNKIIIEKNVIISMQTTFVTHIDMSKSFLSQKFPPLESKIVVNHDSYIGANSTLLMGVIIGECSFIASGSIVTKDVLNYTMVGGVPARIIKKLRL